MRQAAAERCTRAVAAPAPALNDERTLVESESELEALTRPTTCPSHGVHGLPPLAPAPSPTHPARTHARGVTEYPARRGWWCVRGAPEEGDCRRCWWGRGRGGGTRNGAVRGGGLGAGGAGCRRRLQVPGEADRLASDGLAQRGYGARRRGPERTRHAWVVCQYVGGLTGPAAPYISPSSRTCARRR